MSNDFWSWAAGLPDDDARGDLVRKIRSLVGAGIDPKTRTSSFTANERNQLRELRDQYESNRKPLQRRNLRLAPEGHVWDRDDD